MDHTLQPNPLVSIGLPVYNGENYITQCLDSILSQTYDNFELIISDNASTDRTENICRKNAESDKRIIYIRNKNNIGAAKNFNKVFALSKGEYFKWMAHDDVIAPEFLESCVTDLQNNRDAVLSYTRTRFIDESGNPLDMDNPSLNLINSSPYYRFADLVLINHYCVEIFGVFRSDMLRKTSLIRPYAGSDRTLLAELGLIGPFCEVPEYLFLNRYHRQQSIFIHPTRYTRAEWFDPQLKDTLVFPHWRLFWEFVVPVFKLPLTLKDRLGCVFIILKWSFKNRNSMVQDFRRATKIIVGHFQNSFLN